MKVVQNHRVELSKEQELERMVHPRQAAEIAGVSLATFKRTFPHLIRKISERRYGVKLRDALDPR
jgi:hypothetical protein